MKPSDLRRWLSVRWHCRWRFRVLRIACWIYGHDDWTVPGAGSIRSMCLNCGRKTEGWTLDAPGPTLTQPGDRRRHQLNNPRILRWRKRA